jgi:hypothetical protein
MAAVTLLSLFPRLEDVSALAPEDFGGIIIELMPPRRICPSATNSNRIYTNPLSG